MAQIVAINLEDNVVVLDDERVFPITKWIDIYGDEVPPAEAFALVAGAGREWWQFPLSAMRRVTLH